MNIFFRSGRSGKQSIEQNPKEKDKLKSPSLSESDKDKERGHHFKILSPHKDQNGVSMADTYSHCLAVIEDIAKKLLNQDEVNAILRHCKQYVSGGGVEDLVRPLLYILDKPEKLLTLREIRTIIGPTDLGRFDSMVMPYELEAYDILKIRAGRSPVLRQADYGFTPKRHLITPVPDYRGGFHLKPHQDYEKERMMMEEIERLKISTATQKEINPKPFTALEDVPVDRCDIDNTSFKPVSRSPVRSNWLLAESYRTAVPASTTKQAANTTHSEMLDKESGHSKTGGATKSSHHKTGKEKTEKNKDIPLYSLVNKPKKTRPVLDQLFGEVLPNCSGNLHGLNTTTDGQNELKEVLVYTEIEEFLENGHEERKSVNEGTETRIGKSTENKIQEYDLVTVKVSKMKQSLGISISGGIESKVQPVVKIEKIFPGGAASVSETLKAGYELVSVDEESLQNVTHRQAVDIIRRSYSNKSLEPMVFVVKVPKNS